MQAEGWIVSGGQSSRMGRDKALLELGGERLLDRMLGKLHALSLEARIAGLQTPASAGPVEVFPDAQPGCGPLSGIHTALVHSRAECALVLGIDLPLVSTAFLARMLSRAALTGALATVPMLEGTPQPLCAVYRRDLRASLEVALKEGERRVTAAIERCTREADGALDLFSIERLMASQSEDTPQPAVFEFINCNTPVEAERAAWLIDKSSSNT